MTRLGKDEAVDMELESSSGSISHGAGVSKWVKSKVLLEPGERFRTTDAMRSQVTVVVPTLDEEEAIGPLIDEIKVAGYTKILVVDGYSKDKTTEVALARGASVIMQQGKGKAGGLATAFRAVPTPYLVVMDGDGSYDPRDLNRYLTLLSEYSFVKGIRARNENMTRLHRIGNGIITKTFDLLFGTSVGDVCSGMYLLRTKEARELHLEKHSLTVEQEIAAEMVLSTGKTTTIPINYRARRGGKSKTKTWRQGFRDLITNFDLARTYNPILLFSFLAALVTIPAIGLLLYALVQNYVYHVFHSGYFLGSAILMVIGAQGLAVATIAAMLRRIERKLSQVQDLE